MKKRLLAIIATLAMVVAMMPSMVFGADEDPCTMGTSCTHEAAIGTAHYDSIQGAVDAAGNGATIKVLKNITLTSIVTIASDDVIVLDLNGYTVGMEDSSSASCYMIKNSGSLTIKDSQGSGKITFNSTTPDSTFGYSTSTIGNAGTLTVVSGTIENTTVGGASYAIDNFWYNKDVVLNIEGGTITGKRIAVRQVLFSTTFNNTLNVKGGTIEGTTAGIQTHSYQTEPCLADVNITGGNIVGTYSYYTTYTESNGHAKTDIDITGGTFDGYLYIYNGKNGSSEYPLDVNVAGGTFENEPYIYTKDSVGNEVATKAISKGTFKVQPDEAYLVDGAEWDSATNKVTPPTPIQPTIPSKPVDSPNTGDNTAVPFAVAGLILAAMAAAAVARRRYN